MSDVNNTDANSNDLPGRSALPCIFDLCLQLHRSGRISENSFTASLPGCIACGACATLCPESDITIEDREGERLLRLGGKLVATVRMEKCEGCHEYHVATILLEQVARLVDFPKDVVDRKLCPGCKRIAHAAKITGTEPDFTKVRKRKKNSGSGDAQ
jgi:ferredoxin